LILSSWQQEPDSIAILLKIIAKSSPKQKELTNSARINFSAVQITFEEEKQ
jgi:hypothetical protein